MSNSQTGSAFPNVSSDELTTAFDLAGLQAEAAAVTAQANAVQVSANTLSSQLTAIQTTVNNVLIQVTNLQNEVNAISTTVTNTTTIINQIVANNTASTTNITSTTTSVTNITNRTVQTAFVASGADTRVTGNGTATSNYVVSITPTVPSVTYTFRIIAPTSVPPGNNTVTATFYKLNRMVVCAIGSSIPENGIVIAGASSQIIINPSSEVSIASVFMPSATIHGGNGIIPISQEGTIFTYVSSNPNGTKSPGDSCQCLWSFQPTFGQAQLRLAPPNGTGTNWPIGSYYFASSPATFTWFTDN